MRRFLIASAFIFGVFAPTADAQRVVARYRSVDGAGFGFYGPAYRSSAYPAPTFVPAPVAVVPVGPPVRPGHYRDPLYRYRGVVPVGPPVPFWPVPPVAAVPPVPPVVVARPAIPAPVLSPGIQINTPGFQLNIPAVEAFPSEPVISSYPPPPGPAFDVASQLAEGVEHLAASLNTIDDGDIWWDYLQIDALRNVNDNQLIRADGSMTPAASATVDAASSAYLGVMANGQLGRIRRLDGFAQTHDALVVVSQSQSIVDEASIVEEAVDPANEVAPSATPNEPTLAPSPDEASEADDRLELEEATTDGLQPASQIAPADEGSIEELPAPPKIKI
ncbi:hypothetical protein LOC71_00375 [Rhodopirellula sp. JC740]|uniref:Uncharacterized protein n=1 Tax=Rhodopirellula halodulae TaxID=2894198 RepID=A0ABS8NAW2_9BACT|nr:hypothetical protein [Rhodopirellula sp. JC740]MCC9640711.1 hypothetical protein [Rhodopirellula sp. JC740]